MLVAVGILAVVIVAFLVFRGGSNGGNPGGSASSGFGHVHGLGVDPATDTLYAGTHYGLFQLPDDGAATLVADRVQDFMGFTVIGPHHFLASGHPGEGQDGPSALGLIESTDGGETWQPLSLEGEADFHALEVRHGLVYGFNAMTGTFMASEDGTAWESRSSLPMADFAVSPDDPDVVVATTEQGLVRSDDGGRSFALVNGAPLLLLVSWADDGTIVGVSPEGSVQVSSDDAATWSTRGALDSAPEALLAQSRDEIYVAAGATVLVSTNGGRDFAVRYQD